MFLALIGATGFVGHFGGEKLLRKTFGELLDATQLAGAPVPKRKKSIGHLRPAYIRAYTYGFLMGVLLVLRNT